MVLEWVDLSIVCVYLVVRALRATFSAISADPTRQQQVSSATKFFLL
jgi:hypothetical protein